MSTRNYEQWIHTHDDNLHQRITEFGVTKQDLDQANEIHKQKYFVLLLSLRKRIYCEIFMNFHTDSRFREDSLSDEVLRSKIRLIRTIEGFLLVAFEKFYQKINATLPDVTLPPFSPFVEDVIDLAKNFGEIVQTDNGDNRYCDWIELIVAHFWKKWNSRWENFSMIKDIKLVRDYYCALFDAISGLWPAPGRRKFHSDEQKVRLTNWTPILDYETECFRTELYPDLDSFDTSDINFEKLDAAFIEAKGPIRCVETERIREHLTISNTGQLRIYTDWKRFLMLHDHRIVNEIFPIIGGIGFELLQTYILLFFRNEIKRKRNRINQGAKIATRIDIKFTPGVFQEVVELYEDQFNSRAIIAPETFVYFGGRLAKLTKALEGWKPRKVSELRYRGYGGTDPVTLYGFYFSIIVGIVAALGIGLGAIQVYYGYRAS